MKKKKELFVGIFALLFLVSACKNQVTLPSTETSDRTENSSINAENSTDSENEHTELEEVKQNGFDLGGYKLLMTTYQKNTPEEVSLFEESKFFQPNFTKARDRIDTIKKINLLTYAMHYSPEQEQYELGTFLVNTSTIEIKKIKMLIKVKFKTIDNPNYLEYEPKVEDFVTLPPNGVMVLTIWGDTSKTYFEKLKQNTSADITFEIIDLEINGEKVSNDNAA